MAPRRLAAALAVALSVPLACGGCIPLLVGGLVGYEMAKDRDEDKQIAKAPHTSICEHTADGKLACTETVVTETKPAQAAPVITQPAQ